MIAQPILDGFLTLYAIILSSSAAAGLGLSLWLYRKDPGFLLEAGLGITALGLVGARAGFVIRNFSYYIDNPGEMPQIWLGGLSWPGALIGAGAALAAIQLIWKESAGNLADHLLPLLGMVALAVWLTGWGAGIGYGPQTQAWFGIPVRDSLGLLAWRWPLPILGGLASGLWTGGAILIPLKRYRRPGFRAALAVAGLAGINLAISCFRVDPAPSLAGMRWESWFSLALLIAAAAMMVYLKDEKTNG